MYIQAHTTQVNSSSAITGARISVDAGMGLSSIILQIAFIAALLLKDRAQSIE
jgi:hypothetical protein